ncbi:hypothetical protein BGZ96_011581 [Linnemannia gamsii]|uniref:Galactosyl transferase n=1 Tax=Linnemannia gamsii TaxID=64522 RepID=A0ABQ7KB63_9FUNG|nr:hypothetical protein BGZ96_011581 [Linnemannia gamsii]
MAAILHVRKKNILAALIMLILVVSLGGPLLFIHFPRTCIPYVDLKQTGTKPNPRIIILSGEQCTSTDPNSKCRMIGPSSYYNRREYHAHHQGRYDLKDNFTQYFDEVATYGYVPAWAKIKILLDELERDDHDWIFWIDTDATITNMDIELERFVDDRYSLLITEDLNDLNAGVFMLKVDDWSRKYMKDIWSKANKHQNEQDYMISLLKEPEYEVERYVKYLPQCSFNSYWEVKAWHEMYRPGDFVVHWAGHNFDSSTYGRWRPEHHFKNGY